MADREIVDWFTMNGKHIPIYKGESKEDAVNRSIAKDNEDKKNAQIAKNKSQADKLNGKTNDSDKYQQYFKDDKDYNALVEYLGNSSNLTPDEILKSNKLEGHVERLAQKAYGNPTKEQIASIRKAVLDAADKHRQRASKIANV